MSLDRVALPMEVDVPRKPGRPKKNAPKRSEVAAAQQLERAASDSLRAQKLRSRVEEVRRHHANSRRHHLPHQQRRQDGLRRCAPGRPQHRQRHSRSHVQKPRPGPHVPQRCSLASRHGSSAPLPSRARPERALGLRNLLHARAVAPRGPSCRVISMRPRPIHFTARIIKLSKWTRDSQPEKPRKELRSPASGCVSANERNGWPSTCQSTWPPFRSIRQW